MTEKSSNKQTGRTAQGKLDDSQFRVYESRYDPYDDYAEYDDKQSRRRSKKRRSRQQRSSRGSDTAVRTGPAIWVRRILFGLLTLISLIVLLVGARLGMLGIQLNRHVNNIQALAQRDLGDNVSPISTELEGIATTLNTLARDLGPVQPLLNRLDGVTSVGTTLAHASELTDVGSQLTSMALNGLSIGQPLLQDRQSDSFPTEFANLVANSTDSILSLGEQADTLAPRIEALGEAGLLPVLAEPLRDGGATMGFGAAMLQLAPVLPELMGTSKPVTYLILIQNNHELRATGGFITAVGQLTLDKGEIVALDFKDSYEILNHEVEHPWAPEPMQRFLGIGLMFLRDANWSPDLPTAAQLIRTLYGLNEGVRVDGVITVDIHAVERLMQGLGPIRLQGVAQPVTSQNIVEQIKLFWQDAPEINVDGQPGQGGSDSGSSETASSKNWWKHRKDFMPLLGEAAVEKIQSGAVDYLELSQSLFTTLEERSIQVWINEQSVAKQLAALDWDGAIRPIAPAGGQAEQDFIALVDSNFGFNKVDSVLKRVMSYEVEWVDDDVDSGKQRGMATVSIRYEHPLEAPGHLCDITPRYGATYDDMASRCYFNFVRLYVPSGSQLREVEGVDLTTTDSQPGEDGTQIFSAYFIAEPGAEHIVRFRYHLPISIQPDTYSLMVRRQSGTSALPFGATIGINSPATEYISTVIKKGTYTWP